MSWLRPESMVSFRSDFLFAAVCLESDAAGLFANESEPRASAIPTPLYRLRMYVSPECGARAGVLPANVCVRAEAEEGTNMMETGWALIELRSTSVTPDEIVAAVAEAFALRSQDIIGKGRTQSYVLPRQVATYLVREVCGLSWPETGRSLQRDHTSCMFAHARCLSRIQNDGRVASIVARLRAQLAPERNAAE